MGVLYKGIFWCSRAGIQLRCYIYNKLPGDANVAEGSKDSTTTSHLLIFLFKPPKRSDPHSQLTTLLFSFQREPDHNISHIPNLSSYLHTPRAISSTFSTYKGKPPLDPIPSHLLKDFTQAIVPSLINLQCVSQLRIIPTEYKYTIIFSQLISYPLPLQPIPIISPFLCSSYKLLQRAAYPPGTPTPPPMSTFSPHFTRSTLTTSQRWSSLLLEAFFNISRISCSLHFLQLHCPFPFSLPAVSSSSSWLLNTAGPQGLVLRTLPLSVCLCLPLSPQPTHKHHFVSENPETSAFKIHLESEYFSPTPALLSWIKQLSSLS